MPIRIGITGGIGSGKSVLSRILHCAGVPVYDCDTEAKRIMNDNAEVRDLLVQHFGKECYTPDLQLDRKYLAGCIFGNVENLRLVNSIVHPRVKDDFLLWCNTVKSPVVAMESAILFESGFSGAVDFIVCVYADKEVCIARACKRSSLLREEVVRRIDKQSSTETIIEQSDFSICNNPDTPLLPQFEKMMGIIGDKIL